MINYKYLHSGRQLGEALFAFVGRNLELTETGRLVLSYAPVVENHLNAPESG